ncbi:AEC family transporter [Sneathiella chinensis]|uniref:Transporter n=1 Tax=Sneathiella chinensis TaxID=349750 RepID=A0ABQ5U184_9PROT|nr:AEC family transporter [Sneathiella chinensis]GLQ05624.1 transporter [Sneathiella chinensis]
MYQILFNVIAPVLVCAGLGFYWAKTNRQFHMETITGLVTNIGAPTLVFTTLVQLDMALTEFLEFGMIGVLAVACFLVIGFVLLKLWKLDYRAFLPSLIFPNSGNMGLPLCFFAFGEEGLTLALAIFTVNAVLQFTLGVWLASGSSSFKTLLKTPLIYAALLSLGLRAADIHVPEWITDTTELLSGITIPLMLMALGVSLASLSVKHLHLASGISVARLAMGFGVGWGLSWAFNLEGAARGVLILESAMPVAVFNYLFSLRYGRAPAQVAGSVLISTLLSFATLPLLLYYLL